MPDFESLELSHSLTSALRNTGVVLPTPIQERAIPVILKGKDLIAQAQTGTGKTLAFILPILEKANLNHSGPSALIIAPTRELAIQISEEIQKLITDMNELKILAVYGGQDVEKQLKILEDNIHIVVGTPGRLLDHIRRGTLQLSKINCLVLDEADQMLHIGFLNEVEKIIMETPVTDKHSYFRRPFQLKLEKSQINT